ncbi:MAG: hypothetical protein RLZZ338_2450 [Cyanobacteriota bacterium]
MVHQDPIGIQRVVTISLYSGVVLAEASGIRVAPGAIASERYSPAGRPFGVAAVTIPAGTWKVMGIIRKLKL